jgi:hypothetical protein
MSALQELNVPVTNTTIVCDNKTTITFAYNHKIGDRYKHINVTYYILCENIESVWRYLL